MEEGEGGWRGKQDALGCDATSHLSRALTHPSRCNRTRLRVIRG